MTITAKELAEKLNLSAAAVSMALNNKPGVSTATRKMVMDAAVEYGYDFSRISEKHNVTGNIYFVLYKKHGAIVADTPFFSELSDGIVLPGTEMAPEDLTTFQKLPVPFVLLDTYFETVDCNYVLINNVQGAYLATRHLIKMTKKQPDI